MPSKQSVAQPPSPRRSVATILLSLSAAREREAAELRALAEAIEAGDSDELISHPNMSQWKPRQAAELCRSGAIVGAVKQGRFWFAKRSAIEAFIAAGEPPAAAIADDIDAALERALARAR